MKQEIISQGAEAIIYTGKWMETECLVKERISKGYRVKDLDITLRKKRTKQEAKLLTEARRSGVKTPKVFEVKEDKLKIEKLSGIKMRDLLRKTAEEKLELYGERIGEDIAKMHNSDIIHGDLTTSNILVVKDKIYFIDFGLGFYSSSIEDKAVDLYLLYKIIDSTHPEHQNLFWENIKTGYKKIAENNNKIFKKLEEIKKRGRYVVR